MENTAIKVPDPLKLGTVEKFCNIGEPYRITPEIDELMAESFREIINWHTEKNEFYSKFLKMNNFSAESIKSVDDCQNIPFLHANFFKQHEIVTIDRSDVTQHLTSSGTTGQKSQMFFDDWSFRTARRMVDDVYRHYGFYDTNECNYILFAYEPLEGFNVGTTNTNVHMTTYAPVKNIFYALRSMGDGKHEFDVFGTIETILKYAKEDVPVRFFGFPAFIYFTLKRMKALKIEKIKLHPDSLIMCLGGWKGYSNQAITKHELYAMIEEQLGVQSHRMREGYGAVEHSIPYIECPHHNLHVPVWSKLFIRDVRTLDVLGYEQIGYMHFITPEITSVPAISVLMGDLGEMHEGKECGCGVETPYFIIKGRAGVTQNKSCAISAAELLKGK